MRYRKTKHHVWTEQNVGAFLCTLTVFQASHGGPDVLTVKILDAVKGTISIEIYLWMSIAKIKLGHGKRLPVGKITLAVKHYK